MAFHVSAESRRAARRLSVAQTIWCHRLAPDSGYTPNATLPIRYYDFGRLFLYFLQLFYCCSIAALQALSSALHPLKRPII